MLKLTTKLGFFLASMQPDTKFKEVRFGVESEFKI